MIGIRKIGFHLLLLIGISPVIILAIVYPFLAADYDYLAMVLSTMAQAFGGIGLLLLPFGLIWLGYELWKYRQSKRNVATKTRRYYFALISLVLASLVAFLVSVVGFATGSLAFALLSFAIWLYFASRLIPKLTLMKNSEGDDFNFTPLYLIFLPIISLLFQLSFAAPLTEFSRNHAIAMSAEIIGDIEEYHAQNGAYPISLLAAWKDYYPAIVGIEKFHYVPHGDSFNLFFEQPRFLFDNIGTREFVVYNPLGEQRMISHASWILILSPAELESNQGWYAVHDTDSPNWKYFWFD